MPKFRKRKILMAAALSGFLFALVSVADAQNNNILKFEWCRGACDRGHKNLGEWGTEFIHPPPNERCSTASGVTAAMEWIRQHEPGAMLAGWGCVDYENEL